MNSTPQVATQEISDADLDNVSGGLLGGVVGTVTNVADTTLGTVTGLTDSATGLNTTGIAGTASGLAAGI